MTDTERFAETQRQKDCEVKMQKLADILNKKGHKYHPDYEWVMVGVDRETGRRDIRLVQKQENYDRGYVWAKTKIANKVVKSLDDIGITDREFMSENMANICEPTGLRWENGSASGPKESRIKITGYPKDVDMIEKAIDNASKYYDRALTNSFGIKEVILNRIKGKLSR